MGKERGFSSLGEGRICRNWGLGGFLIENWIWSFGWELCEMCKDMIKMNEHKRQIVPKIGETFRACLATQKRQKSLNFHPKF